MRQSQLFTKTRREAPADEVSKNAQLLIRGGFVHKEMAGVYDLLPLGLRVIDRIRTIIREEMNAIGGQEVSLSALQDADAWKKTGRWDDTNIDVWFKTALKGGGELGLGCTHEEPMTTLMKNHVSSYRDVPQYLYQFQTKFRNELRAKSGLMRGREFLMKDMYSFGKDETDLDAFYETVRRAYEKIFARVGIGDVTYYTYASGGMFSKWSHEFQTICDAGEDTIFVDEEKKIAVNKEIMTDAVLAEIGVSKEALIEKSAVEVGNIFKLGTRYSDALGLVCTDESGSTKPVVMGSYGIGLGRLMATAVELFADEKGMVWSESIAPFDVHVLVLGSEGGGVHTHAEKLVMDLERAGIAVLYDDRDVSAGEKFADSDLIGIPLRVVVSEKALAQGGVEIKERKKDDVSIISEAELFQKLTSRS